MRRPRGDTHTITGTGFGVSAGTVALELAVPSGTVIPLTVLSWSDAAAKVRVPTTLPGGIPLHAQGNLRITRADANCVDAVTITFEPPAGMLFSRQSQSASGAHFPPPHTYRKDHTLTSPVLPPRAEPFAGTPDIGLPLGDVKLLPPSSSELSHAGDDPPSVSVKSGPSFTSSRQRTLTVTVTDDYVWNYTVTAEFLIVQPDDETIVSGWTRL